MEDLHVHSSFSDGIAQPEEVARAAFALGLDRLGFTDHGYAPYDLDCCIPEGKVLAYQASVRALKAQYAGRMEILCGVEQDFYSPASTEGFDYVIGSVHYLLLGDEYVPVDYKDHFLLLAARRYFDGDCLALAEEYFRTASQVVSQTHCDLIGHFDLICKLNGNGRLFDEQSPRYIAAWQEAADQLLETGVPFEINTGGMSRGYRQEPYPASPILSYLAKHGASFVLTSDSHDPATLCYDFAAQEAAARALGAELIRFALPTKKRAKP